MKLCVSVEGHITRAEDIRCKGENAVLVSNSGDSVTVLQYVAVALSRQAL